MENNLGCGKVNILWYETKGMKGKDVFKKEFAGGAQPLKHFLECAPDNEWLLIMKSPECSNHSQSPSAGDESDRVSPQSLAVKPTKTEDKGSDVRVTNLASGSFNKKLKEIYEVMKRKGITTVEQIEEKFSSGSDFDLSKKIYKTGDEDVIHIVDIKEFIRRRNELDWQLENNLITWKEHFQEKFKLAGRKLT